MPEQPLPSSPRAILLVVRVALALLDVITPLFTSAVRGQPRPCELDTLRRHAGRPQAHCRLPPDMHVPNTIVKLDSIISFSSDQNSTRQKISATLQMKRLRLKKVDFHRTT